MSNIQTFSGSSLPDMPNIEFVKGDDGVSVGPDPVTHIINLVGGTSTANNTNGLMTTGNAVTFTEKISLTNRLYGAATTVGAVTANLITFPLSATPGTYVIEANFAGFEPTTPAGAGYSFFGTIRTNGTTATVIGISDLIANVDSSLMGTNATMVVSGNNLILQVLGETALSVDWAVVGYYVEVQ